MVFPKPGRVRLHNSRRLLLDDDGQQRRQITAELLPTFVHSPAHDAGHFRDQNSLHFFKFHPHISHRGLLLDVHVGSPLDWNGHKPLRGARLGEELFIDAHVRFLRFDGGCSFGWSVPNGMLRIACLLASPLGVLP